MAWAAVVLLGCSAAPGPDAGPAPSDSGAGTQTLTLEVYGDSLTVADSPSLTEGRTGPQSWLHHLDGTGVGTRLEWVGGAGQWGATAQDVLALLLQPPAGADLLVLALGTNDLATAGPGLQEAHDRYVDALEQIVEQQGYSAGQVVIVAVGPFDTGEDTWAARAEQWNELSATAAASHGWHLVDPWTSLRGPGHRYADPDLTTDGLHLSEAGAQRLAAGLARELEHVGRDAPARVP